MHAILETLHSRTWTRSMLHQLVETKLGNRKLIVVANREPYIHRYRGSHIECFRPASGMATALHPIMTAAGGTWIGHGSGDADRATVDAADHVAVPPDDPAYTLRRVWLTREQEEGFYYGLSNEGLWPLCHMAFTRPVFRERDWEIYKEVNALFAQAVLDETAGEPALVFIQDYHFALLPRMLKDLAGNRLVVAQFWHIPWPNREIFRAFPWREEMLDGLLGNDLLGFQVRYHCQNFLETVDRAIEARVDHERFQITRSGSPTLVRPFPISIDFAERAEEAATEEVDTAVEFWRDRLRLGDRLLGIGLERLDYTKGIPERLRGFDDFLAKNPAWRERVVFTQIAVPSRSQLDEYRKIEEEVEALAGEINDRWRHGDWVPIILLKQHFDSTDMMALHRLASFCIVSSLHDGMNLVAKEFIASRNDEEGVLILSRFAGAHRELPEALEINPFATHEVSAAMLRALEMPGDEQRKRMQRLRDQVAYNNVFRWAGKFLSELLKFELPENGQDPALDEPLGIDRREDCAAA
jgi:trehalose 6-phosphate synthase